MPPLNLSLEPYSGIFGPEQAAHLVRRTIFSFTQELRNEALALGLQASVDKLLTIEAMPDPPLNYGVVDLAVPIGETWVNAIFEQTGYRRRSMAAWTAEQMARQELNIREKMVLFWHNHFPIADINDPHFIYKYSDTLRQYALGNFRDLTKAITIDPTMLRYLNGNSNTRNAPNENYARELLELFTIGKGPIAGPGDYTNYTEEDIKEIARILTGWRDVGYLGRQQQQPGSIFIAARHDQGSKQLSHRFDNIIINNMGENEYAHLIDIIFSKDEVARYICRKLYRWFVYYDISTDIESNIIDPLAQTLVSNDYNILPVLRQLLSSEHFFDSELMGCQIKNPYEFIIPIFTTFKANSPSQLNNQYAFYNVIFNAAVLLDMTYYGIPQVAGWKAYYQEPVYNRYWINNVTLGIRTSAVDIVMLTGIRAGDERILPDLLGFIDSLSNPSDPNKLIEDTANLIFTNGITTDQINFFKEALIPGLPDFEWTVEYNNYLADPNDELLRLSILLKLSTLFRKMLNSPDYHLQ